MRCPNRRLQCAIVWNTLSVRRASDVSERSGETRRSIASLI